MKYFKDGNNALTDAIRRTSVLSAWGKRLSVIQAICTPIKGKVSIITVCLNSELTILQTIQSVRNQTYNDIEYIVIDGGSTDGTEDICKGNSDCIDLFISEKDSGIYHAMNKGVAYSLGEYVIFLNSDDIYYKTTIEKLVSSKMLSGAHFSTGLAKYISDVKRDFVLKSMLFDNSCFLRMPLRHELMLISRDIYETLGGYDESLMILGDLDFTKRLYESNYVYIEVQEPLLEFRTKGISSTQKSRVRDERLKLYKQYFLKEDYSNLKKVAYCDDKMDLLETYLSLDQKDSDFASSLKSLIVRKSYDSTENVCDLKVRISVIIAIYNAEALLTRCLSSIINSTFTKFEIICVIDKSPDNSEIIVRDFMSKDKRIKLLKNKQNFGLGQTRNIGIRKAIGEYIFHIDPDDTLPKDALEDLYNNAVDTGAEIVKGRYKKLDAEGNLIRKSKKFAKKNINIKSLKNLKPLAFQTEGHWSFLYKRELAKKICYPTDLTMGQDSLFLIRVLCSAKCISCINTFVYNYHIHPNSTMQNFNSQKWIDSLVWRHRAFTLLCENGYPDIAQHLVETYWPKNYFDSAMISLGGTEKEHEFKNCISLINGMDALDFTKKGVPFFLQKKNVKKISKVMKQFRFKNLFKTKKFHNEK